MQMARIEASKTTDYKKKALYLMALGQVITEKLTDDDFLSVRFVKGTMEINSDNELLIAKLKKLWNEMRDEND